MTEFSLIQGFLNFAGTGLIAGALSLLAGLVYLLRCRAKEPQITPQTSSAP